MAPSAALYIFFCILCWSFSHSPVLIGLASLWIICLWPNSMPPWVMLISWKGKNQYVASMVGKWAWESTVLLSDYSIFSLVDSFFPSTHDTWHRTCRPLIKILKWMTTKSGPPKSFLWWALGKGTSTVYSYPNAFPINLPLSSQCMLLLAPKIQVEYHLIFMNTCEVN